MQTLGSIQKDLCELEIQTGIIQASVGQVSGIQASLQQASESIIKIEWVINLRVIPLPYGTLRVESEEDKAHLGKIKDVGVNLAVFPLQTLHMLHQGVSNELQIKEHRDISN